MFVLSRLADPQVEEVCSSPEGTARSCPRTPVLPMSPFRALEEKTRSSALSPLTMIAQIPLSDARV